MNLHRVVNCALALSLIPALGVAQGPKQTQGTYSTCPSENELYVAEILNWRAQKLILEPTH